MKCTQCNGTGHAPKADIEERIASYRARCTELEYIVSWDGWVDTYTVAALLNRAPGTIRNWRYQDRQLQGREMYGRVHYNLREIAQMTIDAENKFD